MGFITQLKSKPIDGEVTTYSILPPASDNGGSVYLVALEQGSKWTLNYKKAGQYRSNGTSWVYMGARYLRQLHQRYRTVREQTLNV